MDSHRYDSLTRFFARYRSRRMLLGEIAGAAVAGAALLPRAARADAGGTVPAATCVSAQARPTREVTAVPPFPAFIIGGTCDKLNTKTSYNLINVSSGPNDQGSSDVSVIPVARSTTSLSIKLAKLTSANFALVIEASSSDQTAIACGNLGLSSSGAKLMVGLQEQNGSGYSGIANFTSSDSTTAVDVFVARGLFESAAGTTSAAFAAGDVVVALVDINLRSAASENAGVVAILGQGSELDVTGPAQGQWLPVEDPASGDKGYVNLQYIEKQ